MLEQIVDNDEKEVSLVDNDEEEVSLSGTAIRPLDQYSGNLGNPSSSLSGRRLQIQSSVGINTWHGAFGGSGPANGIIIYQHHVVDGVGESHIIEMPDTIADDVLPQSQRGRSDQDTNHSSQIPTFIMIPVQVVAILLTNGSTTTTSSLTGNRKLLLHFAMCCNFIGFSFLLYVLLIGSHIDRSVSRFMSTIGYTATSFGFLAAMGMMLDDNIMLWVTAVACIVCTPALLSLFLKQRNKG